jgi:hypothetical protein
VEPSPKRSVVTSRSDLEGKTLVRAVLRFNGNILGLVFGTIGALVVFLATNWLLIKGGETVGPHLSLLGQFFIGYSVTFVGSLIGAAYAFVSGYLAGLIVAYVYNGVTRLKGN